MRKQKRPGQKSDRHDAFELADALRIGAIETRVHKGLGRYKTLRQLVRAHRMVVQDVVRVQARLKALYRSRGVRAVGQSVYGAKRGTWLAQLDKALLPSVAILYEELDALSELRQKAREALIEESHRHGITHVLETAPGMGPIRVAEVVSIVVAPQRFRTARQFW